MLALAIALAAIAQPDSIDPAIDAVHVAEGLGSGHQMLTVAIAFIDDDTILAANRFDGTIRRIDLIDGQTVTPGPVVHDLDIIAPKLGDSQTEYGVQALALHPDFNTNHYVYVRYDKSLTPGRDTPQDEVSPDDNFSAGQPTDNTIERYVWDPDANGGIGALSFDKTIYTVSFDTRYHHGGPIAFDASNHLYTIIGDLRHQNFVDGHFGNLTTTNRANGVPYDAAVILRLEDDGSIPPDNPFDTTDPGVPDEAAAWFAYGIRNSFGLEIDPATDNLWDTDNGEAQWDEINRVEPGMNGGNLDIMGPENHPGQTGDTDDLVEYPGSHYSDPEFSWIGTVGVTAIHFLHASALGPDYDHLALVGNVNNPMLWAFPLAPDRLGFDFHNDALDDLVDDRVEPNLDPIGTEAEELLFAEHFGEVSLGVIAIARGRDNLPYVLTGTGDLYRLAPGCAADFNDDDETNILDFVAFQNAFLDAHPSADCDKSNTLTILDFVCFQQAFQQGCP